MRRRVPWMLLVVPRGTVITVVACSPESAVDSARVSTAYSDEFHDQCIQSTQPYGLAPHPNMREPTPQEKCRILELIEKASRSQTCGGSAFANGMAALTSGKFWVFDTPRAGQPGEIGWTGWERQVTVDGQGNVLNVSYLPAGFALKTDLLFSPNEVHRLEVGIHELSGHGQDAPGHYNDFVNTPPGVMSPWYQQIYNMAFACGLEAQ